MNFKCVLEIILATEQDDIFKAKNIDDLYEIFLQYNYEFSIEQFYKDFIEFFSFVLRNEIKELSDVESTELAGGKTNLHTKLKAGLLSTVIAIGSANIFNVSATQSPRSKHAAQIKISNKSKAQKILDFTKEFTSKFINSTDLKNIFYGLLAIGIPVAVICTILLIRTADSPEKTILNFKTGIENAKNNENYKDSIVELYVATHNKLLELSKIKNTNKIQSSDISCDDTGEKLKQALKEKAQIFENQNYYQDLIKVIDEIKFEEVKKEELKITETQEQTQQTSNIQKPIINLENQQIILTTETEKPENLVAYKNVDVNITNDTFNNIQFTENEKEWIKFLAGVLECTDTESCLKELKNGGKILSLPKNSRFKLCSKFCEWSNNRNGPMEDMHNYVQIVFPNIAVGQGDSDLYFDRLGKDKWSKFFADNKNIVEKIRYNLNLRLIHMLKFWGFQVNINNETQKIESLSVSKSKVLQKNFDHNQQRFTRVLHCLRLFGLNDEYKLLIDIVKKAKENNKLKENTYKFYTETKNTECLIGDYKLDLTHN